jgi:hypothetical protein
LLDVVGKDAERDLIHEVQEEPKVSGNLSTGPRLGETIAKNDKLL